jgi:hypothetical protein
MTNANSRYEEVWEEELSSRLAQAKVRCYLKNKLKQKGLGCVSSGRVPAQQA